MNILLPIYIYTIIRLECVFFSIFILYIILLFIYRPVARVQYELQRPSARGEGPQTVAIYVYPAHEPFQLIYYIIREHTHTHIILLWWWCVINWTARWNKNKRGTYTVYVYIYTER